MAWLVASTEVPKPEQSRWMKALSEFPISSIADSQYKFPNKGKSLSESQQ